MQKSSPPSLSWRPALVAALSCWGIATTSHAAITAQSFSTVDDSIAIAASAEVRNLRVTLIDLTPGDGLSPWIQFQRNPAAPYDAFVSAQGVMDEATAQDMKAATGLRPSFGDHSVVSVPGLFPAGELVTFSPTGGTDWVMTTDVGAASSDGTSQAEFRNGTLGTSARLTSGDLQQFGTSENPDGAWSVETGARASIGGDSGYGYSSDVQIDPETGESRVVFFGFSRGVVTDGPDGLRFILGENTAVVFEGTLAAESLAVADVLGSNAHDITAISGAVMSRIDAKDGRTSWSSGEELLAAYDFQEAYNEAYVASDSGTSNSTASFRDFSFTMSNNSAGLVQGRLDLGAAAMVAVRSVPEPQTWALMGLGLVGIAAVARRRVAKPA